MKSKARHIQRGVHEHVFDVTLIPENEIETAAIKAVENLSATFEQREMIENYIHFNLSLGVGPYSVVDAGIISNSRTSIKVSTR